MLSKLQAFLEVAKTNNITKAADNLYTSQPSISMKIKGLEEQLGTKLFDQKKKMMILTEEGKVFLRYAEGICQLFDEATMTINDFRGLNRGTLSVSTTSYYGSYLLPNMLGNFKSQYPKINIQIKMALSEDVIQDVLVNNYELGFIGETEHINKYPHLVCKPFFTDEIVLICSRRTPYATMNEIDLVSLKDETFIISNKASSFRSMIENTFQKHDIKFNNFIILNHVESIKRSVENNLGFSILPKLAVEREIELGLLQTITMKESKNKLQYPIYYIHRNDKLLSRAADEFLKMSINHFSNLSNHAH